LPEIYCGERDLTSSRAVVERVYEDCNSRRVNKEEAAHIVDPSLVSSDPRANRGTPRST